MYIYITIDTYINYVFASSGVPADGMLEAKLVVRSASQG